MNEEEKYPLLTKYKREKSLPRKLDAALEERLLSIPNRERRSRWQPVATVLLVAAILVLGVFIGLPRTSETMEDVVTYLSIEDDFLIDEEDEDWGDFLFEY